jgi:hypothetical protein
MLQASRTSKTILGGILNAINPKLQIEDAAFASCIARANRLTPQAHRRQVKVNDASRNKEKKKKKKRERVR